MTLNRMILACFLFLPTMAFAQPNTGWADNYLYFKMGTLNWDDSPNHLHDLLTSKYNLSENYQLVSEVDPEKIFKLGEGYGITEFFGLESELVYFGESQVDVIDGTQSFHFRRKGYGVNLGAALQMHLSVFTLYCKGGFTYWRFETKLEPSISGYTTKAHEMGFDPLLAAGCRVDLGNRFLFDLSWENSKADHRSYNSVALSVAFKY